MKNNIFLTKSRYVNGLKCSKWLWLSFNEPDKIPEPNKEALFRFDEGRKIGDLAKSLFSEGINISELDIQENHKKTQILLNKKKPLFEAGFIDKNGKCYARADILNPIGKDYWDIIEVKSATEVKDEYIWDVAFQRYCYESNGIKIKNCIIAHVNKEYVKDGEIDAKQFFVLEDITERVEEELSKVSDNITKLFEIAELNVCPEIKNGESYHDDELNVHENDRFWKEHTGCDILDLYYGGKKAIEAFNQGRLFIKDLTDDDFTSRPQKKQQFIQYESAKSGKINCNKEEIKNFIKKLNYPLYFMDFETYATTIPLYDGVKPFQALPFQFSVHIIEKEGDKPKHHSFIASGDKDPRIEFAKNLKIAVGEKGTVLAYYQSFEKSRLKELAESFPENAVWIKILMDRMVDLYDPFKNFSYYNPSQKGSASLKKVLPALTGKTYKELKIGNGSDASLAYLFITHGSPDGKKASDKEIKQVRDNLEEYCGLDTEGMIWILDKLKKIIDENN